MKKAFTFLAVLTISTIAFSQQLHLTQFATLTHNDTITTFYGSDAFKSAHNAAVHGDIITLSPGSFNCVCITKAVTVRGAGMLRDTVAMTQPTTITGRFWVQIPNLADHHLTMEGICFSGDYFVYRTLYNPHFNKCKFNSIVRHSHDNTYGYVDVSCSLPIFTNCIIGSWDGATTASNAMFINSIVLSSMTGSSPSIRDHYNDNGWSYSWNNNEQYNRGISADVYYNCIIGISPTLTNNKRNIVNCITFSHDTTQGSAANVYNTVGIDDSSNFYTITSNHGNTNVSSLESIFKTFRGNYTEGETFELTPEAAATYLGSDGTQVGIYGGSAVYNPKATDMRIKKYSVGFYSDENGQLKITTELENE
jgi:hypothetical protein